MREIFGPTLWPDGTRHPRRRMLRGLLVAPLIIGLLLTLFRVLLAVIAGLRGGELYGAGMRAFEVSVLTVFGFTATFGLVGVAALWAARQRGAVLWAVTGGILGGLAAFVTGATESTEIAAAALLGWALFLTIRWQAGIRG